MTRFLLFPILLICSISAKAEKSICDGKWENEQPVHVVVDWDKESVSVNGVVTRIIDATSNAIFTSKHKNKFGHTVIFSVINSPYNAYNLQNGRFLYKSSKTATFVMQVDINTKTMNSSHALYCVKSFTKALMARVI